MKWTIGKKLAMAFTCIILLVILVTVATNYFGLQVVFNANEVVELKFPSLKALDHMKILLYEKRIIYERYFFTNDKMHLEQLKSIQDEYGKNLLVYLSHPLDESEWQLINKFDPLVKNYSNRLDDAVSYFNSNPDNLEGTMRLFAEADLVFDKDIIPTIELLHEFKNNETDKMVNDIRNSSKIIIWVVSIPFIFVIIASALLSFFLSRNMSRAIISLTEAADAISLGDFSKAVTATTKDEIGDLAQAVERMRVSLQKALERLKKRK